MFADNVPEHIRNSYVLTEPEPQEPGANGDLNHHLDSAVNPPEQDYIVLQKNDLPILLKALAKLPLEESLSLFTRLKRSLANGCSGCKRRIKGE